MVLEFSAVDVSASTAVVSISVDDAIDVTVDIAACGDVGDSVDVVSDAGRIVPLVSMSGMMVVVASVIKVVITLIVRKQPTVWALKASCGTLSPVILTFSNSLSGKNTTKFTLIFAYLCTMHMCI